MEAAKCNQRYPIMAVKNKKQKSQLGEEGQAIFELLVFMPILIFFYTIIFNVGNSINVSINQQKATRRYFYHLIKGNSYLPNTRDLNGFRTGYTRVGISLVGYADRLSGGSTGSPIAPCFKFNSFFTGNDGEECEEESPGERQTSFVRVFTAYGICGETYSLQGNKWMVFNAQSPGEPDPKSNPNSCSVRQ